ncbi:MAG TPA: alkaline phosphatase family protein [Thermoleophilaceae bacterium]|nr:alkaline phosphatase family protein [Thermoleophilaceae bacterium]
MSDNLAKVKHLVVLMMENRSFDHMLGYLKADGVLADVDGLDPSRHGNPRVAGGEPEPVKPMAGRFLHHKVQDPGHGAQDVRDQMADGMQGFLRNYVEVLERNKTAWRKAKKGKLPPDSQLRDDVVLGYQQAQDVPVYDYIARNFVVCDRWFSSVAGPTWPNRMYAMTGGIADKDDLGVPSWLPDFVTRRIGELPLYKGKAFPRWLHQDQWRWYSHDPSTLRAADSAFRPGGEGNAFSTDANFAYFNRRTLLEDTTFLDDAARGTLPEVSWIDPNFVDFRALGPPGSNDDHPPSRVILGQELVLTILLALARSPCWNESMLVITYDEHGGFYDHVDPKDYPCPGDTKAGAGVRVPALVVSPYAKQTVSHTVFDHTSLPKTILAGFAAEADREKALEKMGRRTRAANDLGELLPLDQPRKAPIKDLKALAKRFIDWKTTLYSGQYEEDPTLAERTFAHVSELQAEIMTQAAALRGPDLPPGRP